MDLHEELLGELKQLRTSVGATTAGLRNKARLLDHLGGQTAQEAQDKLVSLVQRIQDVKQREAVTYALALTGDASPHIGERRQPMLKKNYGTLRTVQRYEVDGLLELAHLIVEHSAVRQDKQLPDSEDQVSDKQRIADLERVVHMLARRLVHGKGELFILADESMQRYILSLIKVTDRADVDYRYNKLPSSEDQIEFFASEELALLSVKPGRLEDSDDNELPDQLEPIDIPEPPEEL